MHRERWFDKQTKHSCGFDHTDCSTPGFKPYVQRHVCHATLHLRANQWLFDKRYGGKFHDGTFQLWSDTRSEEFPYAHSDGVELFLSETDLEPDATWHLEPVPEPSPPGQKRWRTPAPSASDVDPASEGGDSP